MDKALNEIYEEDIRDRSVTTQIDSKKLDERDLERKKLILELENNGKLKSGVDFHHAALIFQHGEASKDFKKAHEFAKKAVELGDNTARWLYAATFDRWSLSENKPQKYGTQFIQDKNGYWELAQPIDLNTTDEERAQYNVPPLSKALEAFKAKYKI